MATRSLIGVKKGDMVEYVYCHYDGYTSGVGYTLVNFHNDNLKANEVLKFGDLSTLGVRFPSGEELELIKEKGDWSSEITMPYHLWRNEPLNIGTCSLNQYLEASNQSAIDCGEEYRYLWNGSAWECRDYYGNEKDLTNP